MPPLASGHILKRLFRANLYMDEVQGVRFLFGFSKLECVLPSILFFPLLSVLMLMPMHCPETVSALFRENDISGSVQEKSELIGGKLVARHGISIQICF